MILKTLRFLSHLLTEKHMQFFFFTFIKKQLHMLFSELDALEKLSVFKIMTVDNNLVRFPRSR